MMNCLGFFQHLQGRTKILYKILSLISFMTLPIVIADTQRYQTAYGCEGESMRISCDDNHVISIIRANYGRFSITICNKHGNTQWSVNCQSHTTLSVLTKTCTGMSSCTLAADTRTFGDGCPGTQKYLEAHYYCVSESPTTTTTRPLPSFWFTNSMTPAWFPPPSLLDRPSSSSNEDFKITLPAITYKESLANTTLKSTASIVAAETTTEHSVKLPSITRKSSVTHTPTIISIASETEISNYTVKSVMKTIQPSTTTTLAPIKERNYDFTWCPPTFTRGLMWNWTKNEHISELPCPGGATGSATRKCNSGGDWSDSPDLSNCQSAWLIALEKRGRPNTQDSALAVAIDLAKVTGSKALYGGDLIVAAHLIKHLSSRMMKDVSSMFPEPHQKQALVTEFLMASLSTVSSLLKAGMMGPWGDLSGKERREAVTALMIGLEEATFLLANSLAEDTESALVQSHILASARSIRADGSQVHFPSAQDQSMKWAFPDSVLLPPEIIYENSDRSATRVVFLAYKHLEDLLTPTNNSISSRSHGRKPTYVVNSRVVSASLGHGRHIQISELSKPVLLTFSLLRHENVSNPICAFWDYSTHDWSDEGCLVLGFNRSHVTCKCNHLTNFAVLMEEASASGSIVEEFSIIRIVTIVGCLICLVCVIGAILLFSLFKGLSSKRTHVHRHVCICLFVAELAFLVGIWRTDMPVLCGIIAGILLYSVLTTFAWMFAEGVYIYLSVTRLLELDCVTLQWWHYLITYGCPILIVGSVAIADPLSFGTAYHCWLQTDNYTILALIVPVLILLTMQLVLLIASIVHTCKFTTRGSLKTKELSLLSYARSWLRSTTIITVMMVLTWVLGMLLIHKPTFAIAVAFCTFNILQGFSIFMYYCIINQKYVTSLCNADENMDPGNANFTGGTYIEGSSSPPTSVITRVGPSSLSVPENTSYKSFSRDSGHGGSEQEDSPRTPWMYQQRCDLRTKTLGHAKHLTMTPGVVSNSYSFSLLPHTTAITTSPSAIMVDRRTPWNNHLQTYTEVDPVYEEIVNSRGEPIQVSDMSDEDMNKRALVTPLRQISPRNIAQYSPLVVSPLSHRGRCEYRSPVLVNDRYFLTEEALRDFNEATERNLSGELVRHYLSNENLMTVAVLNGEQVVCRLSSPGSQLPSSSEERHCQLGSMNPTSDAMNQQFNAI